MAITRTQAARAVVIVVERAGLGPCDVQGLTGLAWTDELTGQITAAAAIMVPLALIVDNERAMVELR